MKRKTKEDSVKEAEAIQVAELIIGPIIKVIDATLMHMPERINTMKAQLAEMRKGTSVARAFPFPETQDKADEREGQEIVFSKIIELFEARKKCIEQGKKARRGSAGMEVLRQLGMM